MLPYVMAWLSKFEREDEGQGLVSIVAVAALGLLGDQVVAVFESITGSLSV